MSTWRLAIHPRFSSFEFVFQSYRWSDDCTLRSRFRTVQMLCARHWLDWKRIATLCFQTHFLTNVWLLWTKYWTCLSRLKIQKTSTVAFCKVLQVFGAALTIYVYWPCLK